MQVSDVGIGNIAVNRTDSIPLLEQHSSVEDRQTRSKEICQIMINALAKNEGEWGWGTACSL